VVSSLKEEILKSSWSWDHLFRFVSTNQRQDLKKENKIVFYKTVDVRDGWECVSYLILFEEEMNCFFPKVIVNTFVLFIFIER